jgi:hypothetical protein
VNVFNNVILARNRQLPDADRMIETCRSIFKSFNINNLSVCIGWCNDQMKTFSFMEHYCNKKLRIFIIKNRVLVASLKDVSYSGSLVHQKNIYTVLHLLFLL